ncbi:MAG: protein kinase, partial [Verrucomicrobia bacterium]|nr:protein kinase [Verrucomicrobiota bacterium]
FRPTPCCLESGSTSLSPTLVAQTVNRSEAITRPLFEDKMGVELEIYNQFSGKKGIWPLIGHAEYYSIKQKISKISLFNPIGISASKIVKKEIAITLNDQIEIADHLASAIHLLHTAGYIHGDLKQDNVLFLLKPYVTAGFIDFGFTFKPSETHALPFPMEEGYYGSIWFTAPELYGDKNFKGDLFKVETWALGVLLHYLFRGPPSWIALFPQSWKNGALEKKVTSQQQIDMFNKIRTGVEDKRKQLLSIKNRSVSSEYMLLIYDMMRLDPQLRLDSLAITKRVSELKERLVAEQMNTLSI